jgi:broad specificity phosphatase PhoE
VSAPRLILLRHGVTDWNREGRFQGHLDPPLSDTGRREARLAGERLALDATLRPARILSSTLGRALETARIIGELVGLPVTADPRLIEIGQGQWEGRTHAELEVTDADRYLAWRQAAGIRQPPGGEPIGDATRRVTSFLDDVLAGESWPACIVSHGGTLRIMAHALLELGDSDSRALDVDNASISVAVRDGPGWRLERWNDELHLLGSEATHVDETEGRPLAL